MQFSWAIAGYRFAAHYEQGRNRPRNYHMAHNKLGQMYLCNCMRKYALCERLRTKRNPFTKHYMRRKKYAAILANDCFYRL